MSDHCYYFGDSKTQATSPMSNGTSVAGNGKSHTKNGGVIDPPQQSSQHRQPAPAHSNKSPHKSQASGITSPMNLSAASPADFATSLLSQAASLFSSAPLAHQHPFVGEGLSSPLSPTSSMSTSFNIANIIGNKTLTTDLPREAHGRCQPQKQSNNKSSSPVSAMSVIGNSAVSQLQGSPVASNSILEALAMVVACGALSPQRPDNPTVRISSPSNRPPQLGSLAFDGVPFSGGNSSARHSHSQSIPNGNVTSPSKHRNQPDTTTHNQLAANDLSGGRKAARSQPAKTTPPVLFSQSRKSGSSGMEKNVTEKIYDFDDAGNAKTSKPKRESKSPEGDGAAEFPMEAAAAKKRKSGPVANKKPVGSNNIDSQKKAPSKQKSSASKPSTNSNRPLTPKNKTASHSNTNNNHNRRRKLLREQDDEDDDIIDECTDETDDWVADVQPFVHKVYLRFDWKLPSRKTDNPFTSAPHTSNHRTSSPNGIMKAPKAMMKKSGKRKSR